MRKLLTPHVKLIGRPAGPVQDDAIDPGLAEGTPAPLKDDLAGGDSRTELDAAEAKATVLAADANLVHPVEFTRDEDKIELYWKIRDGLPGVAGQQRPDGTALVIEDVCFPPDRIAEGTQDLEDLQSKHGFRPNAAGHAAYGNLHFMITPRLADQGDRERHAAFVFLLEELTRPTGQLGVIGQPT